LKDTLLIGGHFPISRGLNHAVSLTLDAGGNTLQLFTKSPGQWKARNISKEEAESFKALVRDNNINPVIVHDSYLINLATSNESLREKSLRAFVEEIQRAGFIGAGYLVTHMGAHTGAGEDAGLDNLCRSVSRAIEMTGDSSVVILLETTAGQGTSLGYSFSQIARVIDECGGGPRIGVCLDTCHVYAAGYDISTHEGYKKTFEEFDSVIGLDRLAVVHLNDARKGLGSRVDRHAHIGRGMLGLDTFRRLLRDPRLRGTAFILETPEPEKMHKHNMEILRSLI